MLLYSLSTYCLQEHVEDIFIQILTQLKISLYDPDSYLKNQTQINLDKGVGSDVQISYNLT